MNGWDFIERYKRLPKRFIEGTVIVMLTTSDSPTDRDKASQMPEVQEYITKPLTKTKLSALVQNYFPNI